MIAEIDMMAIDRGVCDLLIMTGNPPVYSSLRGADRFCLADVVRPGFDHPVRIPITGYRYSYAKTILFAVFDWEKFSHAIGCKSISDIGIYLDGEDVPGAETIASWVAIPIGDYQQATGNHLTGDSIELRGPTERFDRTAENPFIIGKGPYSSEFKTDAIVVQMKISPDVSYGTSPSRKWHVVGKW